MQWKRVRWLVVKLCWSYGVPADVILAIYGMAAGAIACCRPRQALLAVLFPRGCIFRSGYHIEYQHAYIYNDTNAKLLRNSGVLWKSRLVSSIAYVYTKLSGTRIGSMHYRIRNIPPALQAEYYDS
jgi:hypothetical protein